MIANGVPDKVESSPISKEVRHGAIEEAQTNKKGVRPMVNHQIWRAQKIRSPKRNKLG